MKRAMRYLAAVAVLAGCSKEPLTSPENPTQPNASESAEQLVAPGNAAGKVLAVLDFDDGSSIAFRQEDRVIVASSLSMAGSKASRRVVGNLNRSSSTRSFPGVPRRLRCSRGHGSS